MNPEMKGPAIAKPVLGRLTRLVQGLLLTTSILLLSGCSTQFFYNQLDWVLPWYLEDYVSFKEAQTQTLDSQVAQFLSWHRTQQLPAYADFLGQVNQSIPPRSPQAVNQWLLQIESKINTLYQGVGQYLGPLAQTLTPAQQKELINNLTEKTQTYAQAYVNIGQAQARTMGTERMLELFGDWLGELTPKQTTQIKTFAQSTHWLSPELLYARQQWLQALEKAFNSPKPLQAADIQALFKDRKTFWRAQLKTQYKANRTQLAHLIFQILDQATSQQIEHLKNRIASYRQDFIDLAQHTP